MIQINQIYSHLTVVRLERIKNHIYAVCQCSCGNEKSIRSDALISGKTKSCGCFQKKKLKATVDTTSLRNKRFGSLIAISFSHIINRRSFWLCKCDCGTEKIIRVDGLKSGMVVSCGCYSKKLASQIANNKNRTYRLSKGVNPDIPMESIRKQLWSKYKESGIVFTILKRDMFRCKFCKSTVNLKVHHIVPISINPLLIETKSNLITLCFDCHKKAHNNGNWKTINKSFSKQLTQLMEGE